ncbi:nucleotidyltransferase [Paenibacillus allorhizosphaerae]|uniref:tRNA(Met) cytidine acetate ligase n=1 Tax=Paenibacillus allorhizosphaerae TaxID=2849866 RepID=A0ABN7TF90_9BACL|nr:nucleotidyltransferase [Paenibacillus allorhizosphaerae]CAG7623177.1 tRNA(Met) cytidine acetate ligase [Paenibacillus allorhizosphaerae]
MRTVGLIVEYNPLHNGHYYHYQQSKKTTNCDAAICVMSGHFLQRGEPALVNKWARAEMALRMGADLVLELPVAYSAQPAEWFAFGAVSALDACGVVDNLCFGSESGDIGWLDAAADALQQEPEHLRLLLQGELKRGAAYPAAFSRAVSQLVPGAREEELARPNNTLGLHYLIALRRLGSDIVPQTITRTKAEYNQLNITDKQIASATAIRKLLFEAQTLEGIGPFVPDYTRSILEREWNAGRAPINWEKFARPLMLQLLHHSPEQLAGFHEVTEGLEHRIRRAIAELPPLTGGAVVEGLLDRLKTRRYTRTKLQRMLMRILLNHSKQQLAADVLREGVPYLRVLGFTENGRKLLKRMKTAAKVPIVTKVTDGISPLLDLDIRATSVYALGYDRPGHRDLFRDYFEQPLYIASV